MAIIDTDIGIVQVHIPDIGRLTPVLLFPNVGCESTEPVDIRSAIKPDRLFLADPFPSIDLFLNRIPHGGAFYRGGTNPSNGRVERGSSCWRILANDVGEEGAT